MTGPTPIRAGLLLGAALLAGISMTACRGDRTDARPRQFLPDMDDQPKWKPQSETEFFALQDGTKRTQRRPDPNAVAFARRDFDPVRYADEPWAQDYMVQRASFLAEDDAYFTGKTGPDEFVETIPATVTREMLELGRKQFEINCVACHGYKGDGQGTVALAGMSPIPANLLDPKYTDPAQRISRDGYMFDVIRNGLWNEITGANRMPAYGHNIDAEEAWAIVAYIRALQVSQGVSPDDPEIPDSQRSTLMRTRPTAPATQGVTP